MVSIGSNVGAHFTVALVIVLVWTCGLALLGRVSSTLPAGYATIAVFFSTPAELALWLLGTCFSSGVQSWFLASYTVLTE